MYPHVSLNEMNNFSFALLLAVLLSIVLILPLPATASPAKVPGRSLKLLAPQIDRSLEPDINDLFDKAIALSNQKRDSEAQKVFQQILKLDPKNADAYFNLGVIAEREEKLEQALRYYNQALHFNPKDSDLKQAIKEITDKQTKQKQQALLLKEQQETGQILEAGEKAKKAFHEGRYDEAAKYLQLLSATAPNQSKILFALGQSLRALKNYEWAAYYLKRAIYLDPENEPYRKSLAELDQELESTEDQIIMEASTVAISKFSPLYSAEALAIGLR